MAFAFAASMTAAVPTALSGAWLSEETSMTLPDQSIMTDQYDIDFGAAEGAAGSCKFSELAVMKNVNLQSLGHADIKIDISAAGTWELKDGNIEIKLDKSSIKAGVTPDDVTLEVPDMVFTLMGTTSAEVKKQISGMVNEQMVPQAVKALEKPVVFKAADLEGTVLTVKDDDMVVKFNRK